MCSIPSNEIKVKEAIVAAINPCNVEVAKNGILWLQQLKCDTVNSEGNVQLSFQLIFATDADDSLCLHYRLFGLQLLESIIAHSWNKLASVTKTTIKNHLVELVVRNDLNHNILLNALVKCVVSVVIREWPQQWPDLMSKILGAPCNRTALLVLWRLTEDVGILMNPPNLERRRELLAALDDNIGEIFSYIGHSVQSPDLSVALTALKALTGILEWTPVEESLCDFLCNIVAHDSLDEQCIEAKTVALECISLILNRKHKNSNEKRIILCFFKEHNLAKLISCLKTLLDKTMDPSLNNCYPLLSLSKNVSMVFNFCGQQLLTVGVTEVPQDIFHHFIQQMVAIFEHSNPVIHSIPVNFFKETLKKNAIDQNITLKLFKSVPSKLVKRRQDDIFVRCEFDTFQDYEQCFYKIRAEVLDLLRMMAMNEDELIFTASCQLLESFLDGHDDNWEPLTLIVDAVFNKISEPVKLKLKAIQFIQRLLNTTCQDANILSFQLSCISALLVFMVNEPSEHFQPLLSHTFKLSRFPLDTKSEEIKNLRRHAASFFVKLCKMYPEALEPYFNEIRSQVSAMVESGEMSRMEGCTLNEGLILVSNSIKNEKDRRDFYIKLIESFRTFVQFNMNANEFSQFIGLSSPQTYIECGPNRSMITSLVSSFLSLLKRSSHVQDMYNDILPFFSSFVSLTKCLNELWIPENQSKSWNSETIFAKIASSDKGCLLEGFCIPRLENDVKSEALKCQSYLWALHESLYSLLSSSLVTFGSCILINCPNFFSIFQDVQFLPPMKLRMILKVMIKPVCSRWPDDLDFRHHFFVPLMQFFIPCIFQQANVSWATFRNTDWKEYEQIQDEIIEEQTNRLLSRELMDVMKMILLQDKRGLNTESEEMIDTTLNLTNKPSISELGKYLLSLNLNQIIHMSLTSLSWVDSNVLFKSILINQIILDFLIENHLIQSKEEISFYIQHLLTGLSFMSEEEQNQAAFLTLCLTLYRHSKNVSNGENDIWNSPLIDCNQWKVLDSTLKKLDQHGKKGSGVERKKRDALKSVLSPIIGANLNQVKPEKVCEIRSLEPNAFRSRKVRENEPIDLQGSELCSLFTE